MTSTILKLEFSKIKLEIGTGAYSRTALRIREEPNILHLRDHVESFEKIIKRKFSVSN